MNVLFCKVIAKDGQTAAERFAAMTKNANTFYSVGDELYKGNVLLSATDAAEIAVADVAGNFDGNNVEAVLAEIATLISDEAADAAVTVAKTTGGSGDDYAYRYVFSQGGTPIVNGTIDIAKDMVATEGEIVYPTPADPIVIDGQTITSGTYIKLTIANGDPFYINVADLIEYNTFVNTTEISFADNNHQITPTIGKISGTKIIYREADSSVDPAVSEQTINQKAAELEGAIDALANYVGEIPSTSQATDVIGYVDEKTGAGVDALNGNADIASVSGGVVTLKAGVVETAGIIDNSTDADIVLAKAATTGAAEDIAVTDAGGHFTGSDVETVLTEIASQLVWTEV
ncbi:MAG: hypothetical protein J6O49_20755 [Bacteroidaceae bacterium]|nr:hypothetical protein [Bacteroidaceae bacterium]